MNSIFYIQVEYRTSWKNSDYLASKSIVANTAEYNNSNLVFDTKEALRRHLVTTNKSSRSMNEVKHDLMLLDLPR